MDGLLKRADQTLADNLANRAKANELRLQGRLAAARIKSVLLLHRAEIVKSRHLRRGSAGMTVYAPENSADIASSDHSA